MLKVVKFGGSSLANLGPGFDVLGLALNLYNEVEFKKSQSKNSSIKSDYQGDLEDNLIYKSFKKTVERLKGDIVPVYIKGISNISVSRGLGSSSACILAGIVGAYSLLNDKGFEIL